MNTKKMPVLFIGHGTPMNAAEDNAFSNTWKSLSAHIPAPKAIICISAHWLGHKTTVSAADKMTTIHDFYGFPPELYSLQYNAPGDPELCDKICGLLGKFNPAKDDKRGLDHGTWCFLRHMYPKADIPVLQISIDYGKDMAYHYDLAKSLVPLREQGILITCSGNIVHNLSMVQYGENGLNGELYYDWALRCNNKIKSKIASGDFKDLIKYERLDKDIGLAIPTQEHYIPLLYALGLKESGDSITLFNDMIVGGSLSMTSLFIGGN